jgi:hypothetical protein
VAGAGALRRFRRVNPQAWERRLEIVCRSCSAAAGVECMRSGIPGDRNFTHIPRLEDAAAIIREEKRADGLPAY